MIKTFYQYLYKIRNSFLATVILSMLIGCWCGLNHISYQVCTETGMVLAGMIKYPIETPSLYYHVKVFSLINQVSALLILITESPAFVNGFVSVLLAVISSLALSLLIFCLSRNLYIALFGLCMFINMPLAKGVMYPILLYNSTHTYGIIGLSFLVLTISLFGCAKYRSALFCTGLMPSIHPSWGCFFAVVLIISASFNFYFCLRLAQKYWKVFSFGFGLSIVALAVQFYWMRELPGIADNLKGNYLKAFIEYWDFHRRPYEFANKYNLRAVCTACIGIAGLYLLNYRTRVRFLLTIFIVATVCGFIGGWITLLKNGNVPLFILMLMPGRYINLSILACPALLIGILFSRELCLKKWSVIIFFIVFVACFFRFSFLIPLHLNLLIFALGVPLRLFFALKILCLTVMLLLCLIYTRRLYQYLKKLMNAGKFNLRLILAIAIIILFVIPASMTLVRSIIRGKCIIKINTTRDSSNNPFFRKISEDTGVILNTHEGSLISLKANRPIWFDMAALDGFPMVQECAEKFNSGLKEIYGVSLLEMPANEFRNKGVLLSELHRILWEARSLDCWRTLANKYSFTGIIVPKSWKLTLPISAENEELAYYSLKNK